MEDSVLSHFYNFVHSRSHHTTWAHHFIISLIDEVIRLRTEYENFEYTPSNKEQEGIRPEEGKGAYKGRHRDQQTDDDWHMMFGN